MSDKLIRTADGVIATGCSEFYGLADLSKIYKHWPSIWSIGEGDTVRFDGEGCLTVLLEYPSACGCCPGDIVAVSVRECYSTRHAAVAEMDRLEAEKTEKQVAAEKERQEAKD